MNHAESHSFADRFITCILCCIIVLLCTDSTEYVNKPPDSEYITNQYKSNVEVELKRILLKNDDITSASVFKFTTGDSDIYTGQVKVGSVSKDGHEIKDEHLINPMVDSTNSVQNILLNNVNYENTKTIKLLCEDKFSTSSLFSCERYKQISQNYKSIISIPIVKDVNTGVTGYVMLTLRSEYSHRQVQEIVNRLQDNIKNIEKIECKKGV